METYFTEQQTDFLRLGIKVSDTLYRSRSKYQEIVVVETEGLGRLLALDGFVQLTERDEFVYHEMIAHVPLIAHPNPRRVLVVGGGDGGTVREVLRHPSVERVVLAEIDEEVISVCRRYFPTTSSSLDDPRVQVLVGDGIEHVNRAEPGSYDVVIVDSSEPVGPGVELFRAPFYAAVARSLGEDGIMVAQTESPFYNADLIRQARQAIAVSFPEVRTYLAAVPTYPSGLWSFTLGNKNPMKGTDVPWQTQSTVRADEVFSDFGNDSRSEGTVATLPLVGATAEKRALRMEQLASQTRYWTPALQQAAFHVPRFMLDDWAANGQRGNGHD